MGKLKLRLLPVAEVINISKFQKTTEKLLICDRCTFSFIDDVPDSYHLLNYPCPTCGAKGHVYQGMHKPEGTL